MCMAEPFPNFSSCRYLVRSSYLKFRSFIRAWHIFMIHPHMSWLLGYTCVACLAGSSSSLGMTICMAAASLALDWAQSVSGFGMAIVQAIDRHLAKFNHLKRFIPQAITNVLWSFATLRFFPTASINALVNELLSRLPIIYDQVPLVMSGTLAQGKVIQHLLWNWLSIRVSKYRCHLIASIHTAAS